MDIRSLNTFIQVAELNSFTRAGERLGYSQPTVSFQIKQLESELGVQLFERIGHNVTLTDDGRAALSYAQHICRLSQEMVGGTEEAKEPKGVMHLAMADSLCNPLIIEKFAKFREMYPQVSLKVTTAGTDELFRLLDHNEVDMVCTLDNHIYNTTYIISHEEKIGVHFVAGADNLLAQKSEIHIEEILAQPFILTEKGMSYRRLLDEKLAQNSMEIHPVLEFGSADSICRLVENNMGVSFLPDYVTQKAVKTGRIVRLPVKDFDIELWKQVLYHRDKWVSLQMQAMLSYLSECCLQT